MPVAVRSPATAKPETLPAPIGGVNAVDALVGQPMTDSIFQYNLIPSQYGCKVRTGITSFATGVDTVVRTIIPYNGSSSANDKLFAAARGGIYDITSGPTSPAAAISFGTADNTSGYGGWQNFTTPAGNFSLFCDESNGYFVYTEGGAWAKIAQGSGATQISGVDPATFVWCLVFKTRVWFVAKNSATAYYLSPGALYGAATPFNFGNKFRHGGYLVALYAWTFDGGQGPDDYLVAVSSSGDVVIYAGTDPATADTWSIKGQWYIGTPPAGRRIAGSFGGDLYLLSTYGVLPITKLVSGVLVQDTSQYLSRKITPLIHTQMELANKNLGWEIKFVPTENILLVSVPKQTNAPYEQFVQSLNTQGWAIYRDIPYNTGDFWNNNFYIADASGNVYTHSGTTDAGVQISWSMLSSFQEFGEVARYHQIQFIRPVFLAAQAPSFIAQPRYDYNLVEVFGAPAATNLSAAKWDSAIWDQDLWAGDIAPESVVNGGGGLGRAMAVGLQGQSGAQTILLRFDLVFNTGWVL